MRAISDTPRKVTKREMIDFLSAEFHPDDHEWNEANHIYIGITPTIQRLNDFSAEFDVAWDWIIQEPKIEDTGKLTRTEKPIYRATVVGMLTIGTYDCGLGTRSGPGSDENFDMDTAIKSAQAYALRKAGNLFGVAAYLLSEDTRNDMINLIDNQGEIVALKDRLITSAELNGLEFTDDPGLNAALVAGHYNVLVSDLSDINVLRRLVEANCE